MDQIELLFIISNIWLADSMEVMMLSFIAPALRCEWGLTRTQEATITTVVFVGMLFGASFWGWFNDTYGRRTGYLAASALCLVAGVAAAMSPGFEVLLICRGVVGFGVAGSHVAVTLFSELLPVDKRALFCVLIGGFWAVGAIIEAMLARAARTPARTQQMAACAQHTTHAAPNTPTAPGVVCDDDVPGRHQLAHPHAALSDAPRRDLAHEGLLA